MADDASKAAKRAEIAARVARARAFELEQAAALAAVTPIVNDVASLSLLKRGSGATEWAFAERAATAPPAACMREPLRSLEARFRAPTPCMAVVQDESANNYALYCVLGQGLCGIHPTESFKLLSMRPCVYGKNHWLLRVSIHMRRRSDKASRCSLPRSMAN